MSDADNVLQLRPNERGPELEALVIGGVLAAAEPRGRYIASGLTPEHFQHQRHRVIWQLLGHLVRTKRKIDAATVFAGGMATGLLRDADAGWLADAQTNALLQTQETFTALTGALREAVLRREVAARLEGIAESLRGSSTVGQVRGQLRAADQALTGVAMLDGRASDDLTALLARRDTNLRTQRTSYQPTGFAGLDEEIGGFPEKLNVIAGQPAVGKSAFLASVLLAQLRNDPEFKVGVFGLDDGTQWIAKRWLAQQMAVPLREVDSKRLSPEQEASVADHAAALWPLLERVRTFAFGRLKTHDLIAMAHRWVDEGAKAIWIDTLNVIDHAQPQAGQRWQNDQGIVQTVFALKDFAEEVQIPVICLAHTARSEDRRAHERPPNMQELAGSAFIERCARLILGLWSKDGQMRATVLKATEGPPGATVALTRFAEAAMLDPNGAEKVNVHAERAQARKDAARERARAAFEASQERARMKAALEKEQEKAKAEEPPIPAQVQEGLGL